MGWMIDDVVVVDDDDDDDDDDRSQYQYLCNLSLWGRLGGLLGPSSRPLGIHLGGHDVVDRSRQYETLCHLCVHIARLYALPPMCPHCSLVRSATCVSTFGVLLCRVDAALQLQRRCSGELPWSGKCSSIQRNNEGAPVTSGTGRRTGEKVDEEQEEGVRRRRRRSRRSMRRKRRRKGG